MQDSTPDIGISTLDSDFLLFKNLLRHDLVIINVNKYASKNQYSSKKKP